jgi:integrase
MSNRGHIQRRGRNSFRLKYEIGPRDPVTGQRRIAFETVKVANAREAQRLLTQRLAALDAGDFVMPSRLTLGEHVLAWLADADISPKTRERYDQLCAQQIVLHLGKFRLQDVTPAHVKAWHRKLLQSGGFRGAPLSPRTVGHAHRVLRQALQYAVDLELLTHNPTLKAKAPRTNPIEIRILDPDEITQTLEGLAGHFLLPIVTLALASGLRRGELCALWWRDIDFDNAVIRVERSLEETRQGLRLKAPKTEHGKRLVTIDPGTLEVLREHRRAQNLARLSFGLGGAGPKDYVFAQPDGSPLYPDRLSSLWGRTRNKLKLPDVSFHSFRHVNASLLIAGGYDLMRLSRRLGHAKADYTLRLYGHLYQQTEDRAPAIIARALGGLANTNQT